MLRKRTLEQWGRYRGSRICIRTTASNLLYMICTGYLSKSTSKRKDEMQCGYFFEFASTNTWQSWLVVFDVTLHLTGNIKGFCLEVISGKIIEMGIIMFRIFLLSKLWCFVVGNRPIQFSLCIFLQVLFLILFEAIWWTKEYPFLWFSWNILSGKILPCSQCLRKAILHIIRPQLPEICEQVNLTYYIRCVIQTEVNDSYAVCILYNTSADI